MPQIQPVSAEQAIKIAEDDGGFLGTWVTACPDGGLWLVHAFSKSAKPPVIYVINSDSGKILYKTHNSDLATLTGRATNQPDGAMITTDYGLRVFVNDVRKWPRSVLEKWIAVTGSLTIRIVERQTNATPQAEKNSKLGSASWLSADQSTLVFNHAKWKLAN